MSLTMFRTLFRTDRSFVAVDATGPDAALSAALVDARDRAAADADFALTPERAEAQRAAIVARLGGASLAGARPGDARAGAADDRRVLTFPPREVLGLSGRELAEADVTPTRRAVRSPRPALGWILTAAAAGLVVGVGTGNGIYDELPGAPSAPTSFAAPPLASAPVTADPDDSILADVEVALAGRGVDELRPLDALTPTVSIVATGR